MLGREQEGAGEQGEGKEGAIFLRDSEEQNEVHEKKISGGESPLIFFSSSQS